MPASAPLDRRVDALYGLPLEEFTAARNALAGELNDERIRALAKPPLPVWAINQAARSDKVSVKRLLKAADALRAEQEKSLAGKRADLTGAQQREREAVRALARSAAAAVGRNTQLDRIEKTLSAAALDPEARSLLEAGRLTAEVEPSGFGALAGIKVPPAPKQPKAKPKHDEAKERELRKAAQATERKALAAERAAAEARREADEAAAALAELDE